MKMDEIFWVMDFHKKKIYKNHLKIIHFKGRKNPKNVFFFFALENDLTNEYNCFSFY